eukprot:5912939-Pyramimonas_sp.AAC.1
MPIATPSKASSTPPATPLRTSSGLGNARWAPRRPLQHDAGQGLKTITWNARRGPCQASLRMHAATLSHWPARGSRRVITAACGTSPTPPRMRTI